MVRPGRRTGAERDAWLASQVEALRDDCTAVEEALRGKASKLNRRLQEEARTACADVMAALEAADVPEKHRLLRSALYATRQVERLLKSLPQRSLPPTALTPATFDRIIALRMEFLRRLLPPQ
jgi:hypothetical protein